MNDIDFRKEEYLSLRKEVEAAMEELGTTERYCVYAVAAGFAWLSTKPLEGTFLAAWFLPPIIVFFAALRSLTIGKHLEWLGEYLLRIEKRVRGRCGDCVGWEHFLLEPVERRAPFSRKLVRVKRRGIRGKVTYAFWIVFFAFTLVFSIGGCNAHANTKFYKWLVDLVS
jgi:hypothetical protein